MVSPEVTPKLLVVMVPEHEVHDTCPSDFMLIGPLKFAVMVPYPFRVADVEAELALVKVMVPLLEVHTLK
jgi:hypothetical protein